MVLEELPRPEGTLTREQLDPIVAAAQSGNPDAVQALLRLIKPTVVRYRRARIGGRDQSWLSADDVAHKVCLALLKVLPSYQDRGGSFLYLVRAIAANKVADAFRSVARDPFGARARAAGTPTRRQRAGGYVHDLDLGPGSVGCRRRRRCTKGSCRCGSWLSSRRHRPRTRWGSPLATSASRSTAR